MVHRFLLIVIFWWFLRLPHQVLETPMRMLIRKYPDLAEVVLDQCYKEKKNLGEGVFVDMTFEFIEDSFNYRYTKMHSSG